MDRRVTVAIPTIPPRPAVLVEAIASAWVNTVRPVGFSIAVDTEGDGAAATRNRALMGVDPATSPWVAFLDDDDLMDPDHLEKLLNHAEETGADFVYSWFRTDGFTDPFPESHYLNEFDPANPIETTITTLVRTELAQMVGFHPIPERKLNSGEDYNFVLGCVAAGAKISHLVDRTWTYRAHGFNTSGLASNWKPMYPNFKGHDA